MALQLTVTCSPTSVQNLTELIEVNNATFLVYFLGNLTTPGNAGLHGLDIRQNWVYLYNDMTSRTDI